MKKILSLILIFSLLFLAGCAGSSNPESTAPTVTTGTIPSTTAPAPVPNLNIHFIDVGQADCALLEYDGEYMLIDGGNVSDSSLVVSYLEQQGVEKLEAVVCSHAHEDHVGGLPGVLAVYETKAVYAPTSTYSSGCFDDFLYYTDQQGLSVTIPQPGDVIRLGDVTATVLGPTQSYADPNNTSIVLMVEYGDTRFLFTGDLETQAENDMLDYWGENFNWHADVLKVGHHGSDTSTGYRFLNAIMPQYGIISVGNGNSYGHPHEVPLSRLHDAGVILYRTDELGHIITTSDGTAITITWQSASGAPVIPDDSQDNKDDEGNDKPEMLYIGNKNSKKLHLPTCRNLPKEENRVYFESYDEAINAGYTPCSTCLG
jgi:beta-lactamase superfamily II metal-dependent hydrolase